MEAFREHVRTRNNVNDGVRDNWEPDLPHKLADITIVQLKDWWYKKNLQQYDGNQRGWKGKHAMKWKRMKYLIDKMEAKAMNPKPASDMGLIEQVLNINDLMMAI